MIGRSSRLALLAASRKVGQQIRMDHGSPLAYTVKGHNVPFNPHKPRLLWVKFCIFFAIPYWLPYVIVRHQIVKHA